MNTLPRDKKREVLTDSPLGRILSRAEIEMAVDALEAAEAQQVPQTVKSCEESFEQFSKNVPESEDSRIGYFFAGWRIALANLPPTMSREEIIAIGQKFLQYWYGRIMAISADDLPKFADALEGRIPAKDQSKLAFPSVDAAFEDSRELTYPEVCRGFTTEELQQFAADSEGDGEGGWFKQREFTLHCEIEVNKLSRKKIADLERQHAEDVEKIKYLENQNKAFQEQYVKSGKKIEELEALKDIVEAQAPFVHAFKSQIVYKDRLEAMVHAVESSRTGISSSLSVPEVIERAQNILESLDRVTEAKE